MKNTKTPLFLTILYSILAISWSVIFIGNFFAETVSVGLQIVRGICAVLFWITAITSLLRFRKPQKDSNYTCDVTQEKLFFDTLDLMIDHYHETKTAVDHASLYSSFFEIHKYICDLEMQGKLVTDSKKGIKYLEDIVRNDGPEYTFVINFQSKAFPERKYRIGVCVRGEPLIEIM